MCILEELQILRNLLEEGSSQKANLSPNISSSAAESGNRNSCFDRTNVEHRLHLHEYGRRFGRVSA